MRTPWGTPPSPSPGERIVGSRPFKLGGTWRGLTTPKRSRCPACQKKGLGPWKVHQDRTYRECRYCLHVEAKDIT